jgi:hypothetical protein
MAKNLPSREQMLVVKKAEKVARKEGHVPFGETLPMFALTELNEGIMTYNLRNKYKNGTKSINRRASGIKDIGESGAGSDSSLIQ